MPRRDFDRDAPSRNAEPSLSQILYRCIRTGADAEVHSFLPAVARP
jgi:hypothetical protein